jgi:hypothetical protein
MQNKLFSGDYMPPIANNIVSVINFEFPPVDYPTNGIAVAYSEFKNSADGYGDMKSFICFDAGFRAALQFLEKKFTSHNSESKSAAQIFSEMNKRVASLENFVSRYSSLHSVRG